MATHAESGDVVLDWDAMFAAATGRPLHARTAEDDRMARAVEGRFEDRLFEAIARNPAGRILVVRSAPKRWTRERYRRLWAADVVMLDTPADECLQRLARSGRPAEATSMTAEAIGAWWTAYEPAEVSP